MNNEFIEQSENILSVLIDPIYNISDTRISYIQKLINVTNIYNIDCSSSTLSLPLVDYNNNYYGSITAKNTPQVIDIPPIIFNNYFINISPILVITNQQTNDFDWTTLHEIVHLFSIGRYIISKSYNSDTQSVYHTFGINQYKYNIKNNNLQVHWCEKHNGLNELITDYITWQLVQIIYKSEIQPNYTGIQLLQKFITTELNFNNCIQEFVGWYFSGNIIKIKQSLLNKKFKSFEEFYFYLEKNY